MNGEIGIKENMPQDVSQGRNTEGKHEAEWS